MAPRRAPSLVLLVTGLLALAACATESGGGPPTTEATESGVPSPTASETSPGPETGSPAEPTGTPSFSGGLDASQDPGTPGAITMITGLRTGHHDGFDRIVVDLEGEGLPGWYASYVDEPIREAIGDRAPLDGQAFIEVRVRNVDWTGERGVAEYAGPNPVVPGPAEAGTGVAGVYYSGAFEGDGQVLIGLTGEPRPYAVTTLSDPDRLVIDVAPAP